MSEPSEKHGEVHGREQQILELAAEGLTDKEIARELGISVDTVDTYWRRIRHRLGTSSRTAAVATALMQGTRASEERLGELQTAITSAQRAELALRAVNTSQSIEIAKLAHEVRSLQFERLESAAALRAVGMVVAGEHSIAAIGCGCDAVVLAARPETLTAWGLELDKSVALVPISPDRTNVVTSDRQIPAAVERWPIDAGRWLLRLSIVGDERD